MARRRINLRDLLDQYVAARQNPDPKQRKAPTEELRNELFRISKSKLSSFAKQWGVVLDDRTAEEELSPNVTLDEYAWEVADNVLNHLKEKVDENPTEIVAAKYVYQRIDWRCRSTFRVMLREHSIFWVTMKGERRFVSLGELQERRERGREQKGTPVSPDDLSDDDLPDLDAATPEEILIAKENLKERLGSIPMLKRSFLAMFKEIWPDRETRKRFRDNHLIDHSNRIAFFNRFGSEFEVAPAASEKVLSTRVLTWYSQAFKAARHAYDMKSHLRAAMSQFLNSKDNH